MGSALRDTTSTSPHRRRRGARWRTGLWSQAEVAEALQARREELRRGVACRGDARGLTASALDEVVDDAIRVVVLMRRPILSEEHLMGAFWATARLLLRQHREGRHTVRLGSRVRQDFDDVAGSLVAEGTEVEETLLARERAARAADFISQLEPFERDVVVTMAVEGKGIKAAARSLGVPVKDVKAAHRSARVKLDRVAVISAAGRLCGYRRATILEYARGSATADQERVARAHLAACAACRREHARLIREMRGSRFQRDAVTALIPSTLLASGRPAGLLTRVLASAARFPQQVGAERITEVAGGAGVVKLATVGAAVVAATATIVGLPPSHVPPHKHSRPREAHAARISQTGDRGAASAGAAGPLRASGGTLRVRSREATRPVITSPQPAEREFGLAPPAGNDEPAGTGAPAGPVPSEVSRADEHSEVQAYREFGQP